MTAKDEQAAAYESLRWNILADAVCEDWHGIWEPLWDGELFPAAMPNDERAALASAPCASCSPPGSSCSTACTASEVSATRPRIRPAG